MEQMRRFGQKSENLDNLNQILKLGFVNSRAASFLWCWADDLETGPIMAGAEMMRVEARKVKHFLDKFWDVSRVDGVVITLVKP